MGFLKKMLSIGIGSLALLALGLGQAQAKTIYVYFDSVAQDGSEYIWTYQAQGSQTDSYSTRIEHGDFFVIYDFAGYVPESATAENSDWIFTEPAPNSGPVPVDTNAADNPSIPNLVWTYTGSSIIYPDPNTDKVDLGNFTARSVYSQLSSDFNPYAAQDHQLLNNNWVANSNVGRVQCPTVPLPASLWGGLALCGLVVARRVARKMMA